MEVIYADPAQVAAIEQRFLVVCREVFGLEQVEAILSHGSAIKGGLIPGFSDFDLMVFLTADQFTPHGLPVDKAFDLQRRIDTLGVQEAGFAYAQAYFYHAGALPVWWTGPVPGSYHLLHGEVPAGVEADHERLRQASVGALRRAGAMAASTLNGFIDAHNSDLRRRVRLLRTDVNPLMFSAVAYDREDAAAIWGRDKITVLAMFEERYRGEPGPALVRNFFEGLFAVGAGEAEPERYRQLLRSGVRFLLWADDLAQRIR